MRLVKIAPHFKHAITSQIPSILLLVVSNGMTLGIDWIRINYPVVATKIDDNSVNDVADSADRNDLKDGIKTFNRIPTFLLFGLNIGYSF